MDPNAAAGTAAGENAGAPPAGQNQGQQAAEKPAAPPTPKEPELVRVLPGDWQAIHAELDTLRKADAARQAEIDKRQQEALEEAAKKANAEKTLADFKDAHERRFNELQGRYGKLEEEIRSEKLETTLAQALAGVQLATIPGVDPSITAAQVRRLLSDEIESIRGQDGKFRVQDKKTLRPASEYLAERLKSPEFAPFIKADQKGGSGTADSAARPGQQPQHMPGQQPAAGSPLDAIVADWNRRQGQHQAMGLRPTGR